MGGVKVVVLLGSGPGSGYVRSVVSGGGASSRGGVVAGWFAFFLVFACLRRFCVFVFACWWWACLAWGLVCVCVRVCVRVWVGVWWRGFVAWWCGCWLVGGGCGACALLVCLGRALGLVLVGLVGVVLLVSVLVCFCGGPAFLVCWVCRACLLFRAWCARRVLRVFAFVVGRVACTFFGSVLAGCASGGVFGVCGFCSPVRAPCLSVG